MYYFIKIGKDAKNPLRLLDCELFDIYAPNEIQMYDEKITLMIKHQNKNLKYLKLYNTIFVSLCVLMNAFFIVVSQIYYDHDLNIDPKYKWSTWYAVVLCYFFIW